MLNDVISTLDAPSVTMLVIVGVVLVGAVLLVLALAVDVLFGRRATRWRHRPCSVEPPLAQRTRPRAVEGRPAQQVERTRHLRAIEGAAP